MNTCDVSSNMTEDSNSDGPKKIMYNNVEYHQYNTENQNDFLGVITSFKEVGLSMAISIGDLTIYMSDKLNERVVIIKNNTIINTDNYSNVDFEKLFPDTSRYNTATYKIALFLSSYFKINIIIKKDGGKFSIPFGSDLFADSILEYFDNLDLAQKMEKKTNDKAAERYASVRSIIKNGLKEEQDKHKSFLDYDYDKIFSIIDTRDKGYYQYQYQFEFIFCAEILSTLQSNDDFSSSNDYKKMAEHLDLGSLKLFMEEIEQFKRCRILSEIKSDK